jgi:putative ABC transport system permease protein
MFKNYFKIALRNLARQKVLTFINIFGLSAGLACFTLFMLYAVNEFSFDRLHEKTDRIFRVFRWTEAMKGDDAEGDPYMPMPLGPAMKQDFADVENFVRFREPWGEDFIRVNNSVSRIGVTFADPQIFEVFSFRLQRGEPAAALRELRDMVLTEKTARRLFGEIDPIGKTVEIKLEKEFEAFTITAIAEDLPANSSIQFEALANFEFLTNTAWGKRSQDNWFRSSLETFVLLRPGSTLANDPQRLLAFRQKYYPNEEADLRKPGFWTGKGAPITSGLQPLRTMHTDTRIGGGPTPAIDPKTVWILLAIAAGVLLIACINFTTLAIGRSAGRAREVGIRKVVGSQRRPLVSQFLVESLLLSSISAVIGLALAQMLLPFFNNLSGKSLQLSLTLYPEIRWLFAGMTLLTGLLAGSYPALALSGFRPVEVLKSKIRLGGSNLLTKSLVTLQFVLSVGLIVSTLTILQQLRFMRSKSPGFNKENIVVVDAEGTEAKRIYPLFRQTVLERPEIAGVAASELGLGAGRGWSRSGWDDNGKHYEVYEYFVDENYLAVMDLHLLAGRNFDPAIAADSRTSVIVNESFLKTFGWTKEEALGKRLTGYTEDADRLPTIIGVVKDFHFRSFHEEVRPQMFQHFVDYAPLKFFVRIRPGEPTVALQALQSAWRSVVPDLPFTYSFLDEDLDGFYKAEARWGAIVGWAGGIAIFLGCLGLFGLAALAAVNRTKEIGIRKVLGAPVAGIIALLSKDFVKLVLIANLIAWPVAWYAMNKWLLDFAYRIELSWPREITGLHFLKMIVQDPTNGLYFFFSEISISRSWWTFALAGGMAVMIALLTVSAQAIRAALANPVEALRYE